jgi:hypothetical protein
MSSRYVYNTDIETQPGLFSGTTQPVWLQFVPGLVHYVFTSKETAGFYKESLVNSIEAYAHYESTTQNKSMSTETYKPLLRGFVDVPIIGDQVLLTTIGGQNYYLGPVNTINSPNFNIDHLHTQKQTLSSFELEYNSTTDFFDESGVSRIFPLTKVERLNKLYSNKDLDGDGTDIEVSGDMMIEGRFANSIRVGARDGNPLMIIQNNRDKLKSTETTNEGSVISLLSKGSIRAHFENDFRLFKNRIEPFEFNLSSDTSINEETPRTMISGEEYNYEYGTDQDQILMRSERITIDSRTDSIFLSSFKHTYIGCGESLIIKTNNQTEIDSETIYLGKQVEEPEPVVKGQQLKIVLESMLSLLEGMQFICTGAIAPVMINNMPVTGHLEIADVRNDLEKILSNKVYLES